MEPTTHWKHWGNIEDMDTFIKELNNSSAIIIINKIINVSTIN